MTSYSGDANDNGFVSIWSGSGYDLTNQSGDALFINTENPAATQVTAKGNAVVSELTNLSIQNTATNQSIAFTYDGSSALVLLFGAQTGGYPFPVVEYDNIRIQSSAIPEPATFLWVLPIAGFVFFRRNSAKKS